MRRCIYFLIITFLLSCSSTKEVVINTEPINYYIEETTTDLKNWYHKDIYTDSIPGISLDKAYKELLHNKKGDTVIVAIIDTELDIDHEDIKDQIWTNTDEIPNNNVDDDKNGYVDDIHGWNYIGTKKGDSIPYSSYESVRIIRKYDTIFKNVSSTDNMSADEKEQYELYQKAQKDYAKRVQYKNDEIARFKRISDVYHEGLKTAERYLSRRDYSIKTLDSLKEKITDEEDITFITELIKYTNYGIDDELIAQSIAYQEYQLNTLLNVNYNDRYITNDDIHDINDFPYGNNNVEGTHSISHALKVSSVIASKRNNNVGIDGVYDHIKLMALSMAVVGNEFDKDIALAIRYAVENGADIINLSLGKNLSMYPEWLQEAIEFAEDNDVLVITSSGNSNLNIDTDSEFPNDHNNNIEFAENFLTVGSSSKNLNANLVSSFSNYGKINVDIFAPGQNIECLNRWKVTKDSGTSLSCAVTSGVAALIRSYYPNLSAAEVKQIIMESGVSYDIMVNKPSSSNEKELIPFISLSKSGKIVNAYNALSLAEKVSKKKKK